jgi:hypothetical protein
MGHGSRHGILDLVTGLFLTLGSIEKVDQGV